MDRKFPEDKTPQELYSGVVVLRDNLRPPAGPFDSLENPEWLFYGIWDAVYLCDFLGADYQRDYKDFAFIDNPAEVENFDINRVMTWFVVFANRERTCDGLIADGANHGTLFLVANRLITLIEDDPRTSSWASAHGERKQ